MRQLKSIAGTDKGPKYLDFDDVLEILFDVWCAVRLRWEDHLMYLFSKHCSVYRVLGDVVFATDVLGGPKDRDVVLVNISKTASSDCSRRPMRMIQRPNAAKETNEVNETNRVRTRQFKQGNANKESVCDAMSREEFGVVVSLISPSSTLEEVRRIFFIKITLIISAHFVLLFRSILCLTTHVIFLSSLSHEHWIECGRGVGTKR